MVLGQSINLALIEEPFDQALSLVINKAVDDVQSLFFINEVDFLDVWLVESLYGFLEGRFDCQFCCCKEPVGNLYCCSTWQLGLTIQNPEVIIKVGLIILRIESQ